jgi:hypothetical protein
MGITRKNTSSSFDWKKDGHKFYFLGLFAALLMLTVVFFYKNYVQVAEAYDEMKITSITYENNQAMIILEGRCRKFSFIVPKAQGESIEYFLFNYNYSVAPESPVPSTMRITENGSEYYGEIVMNSMISVGVKTEPGEALAIALRARTPIFISRGISRIVC